MKRPTGLNVTAGMKTARIKPWFIIPAMKTLRWLAPALTFLLLACQPEFSPEITIIDNGSARTLRAAERIPLLLLTQNGYSLQPQDRVLWNGQPLALDETLPNISNAQLQIRRAVSLTVITPQGTQTLVSSALTVGQALAEAGFTLSVNDRISPPPGTPITNSLQIEYAPAWEYTLMLGESQLAIRSAAETVHGVLADAGIPLVGADFSSPAENDAPPPDGVIRVTRVREAFEFEFKPIPFKEEVVNSPDLPFGQSETLQPGLEGLSLIRTRVRYENGIETVRTLEEESVVREPQTRIVQSGEKIVLNPVGGNIPYEYWTAVEMYATVYSPCASGTGGCSYGTASGARAGYGIVAVDYSIYPDLAGMRVYVPGYGVGTIGDTGGGPIIESALGVPRTQWIDLGYDDGALGNLTGWVTVYFLAPAPAEIPYYLK